MSNRLRLTLCALCGLMLLLGCTESGSSNPDHGLAHDSASKDQLARGSTVLDGPSAADASSCANCSGCCSTDNVCMPGNTVTACGSKGGACAACVGFQKCQAGVCQKPGLSCDATTCATCCNAQDVCIGPSSNTFCGLNGAACQQCNAKQNCRQGKCEAIVYYDIVLFSAQVSHADCGFGDDCDTYVELKLGTGIPVKSATFDNSENPAWKAVLLRATELELITKKLLIIAKDDDGALNPDDDLGSCELQVKEQDLIAGQLVSDCGTKVKALTLRFVKITP